MIYINNISNLTCEDLESKVCSERIKYASKYKFEIDRRRSLAVEALLNDALMMEGCICKCPVRVSHFDSQQPYFVDEVTYASGEKVYFSLSHSGDYVAVAIDSSPIGIDIEKVSERKSTESIARKFFSESERKIMSEYIGDNTNNRCENTGKNTDGFAGIWTLKEAFIKSLGCGLSFGIDSFFVRRIDSYGDDFAIAKEKAESLKLNIDDSSIFIYGHSYDNNTYYGYCLDAPDGYAVSVCARK